MSGKRADGSKNGAGKLRCISGQHEGNERIANALPNPRTAAAERPLAAAGSSTYRICWMGVNPMASADSRSSGSSCSSRAWKTSTMVGRMSTLSVRAAVIREKPVPAANHSRTRGTSKKTDTNPIMTVGMLVMKWIRVSRKRGKNPAKAHEPGTNADGGRKCKDKRQNRKGKRAGAHGQDSEFAGNRLPVPGKNLGQAIPCEQGQAEVKQAAGEWTGWPPVETVAATKRLHSIHFSDGLFFGNETGVRVFVICYAWLFYFRAIRYMLLPDFSVLLNLGGSFPAIRHQLERELVVSHRQPAKVHLHAERLPRRDSGFG